MPSWRSASQIMEEMAVRGTPISEDIAMRMSQLEQEIVQEERAAALANESNPQNIQVVDLEELYQRAQRFRGSPGDPGNGTAPPPPWLMPPPRSNVENFWIMVSIAGMLAAYVIATETTKT